MTITLYQQIRKPLLVIISASVFLLLVRSLLNPTVSVREQEGTTIFRTVTPYTFPTEVRLPEWRYLASNSLINTVNQQSGKYKSVVAVMHYRYILENRPLDLEMRYVVGTLGEIDLLLEKHKLIKLPLGQLSRSLRQKKGIGFYGLFVYKERAYLSACINPRGDSTLTSSQFLDNRNTYDFERSRLLSWLLGQESLRDERCLWALLSTSLNQDSAESTYPVLEKAWFSWYEWWRPRFPKH